MKGMQKNNGIPLSQQTANGGGPRAGQLINGEAWAGFQDKTWGELHIGRNNMISTDMTGAYDPLASYGFSLLGYFGLLAGQGSSDTARIDQSIKYLNNFGPWRMSVVYGKPETNVKEFYQGSVGFVRPNFSVDVIAGHGSDLVSTFALSGSANINSKYLGAKVFDSDMVGAFGKYVFDLGHNGLQDPAERKFTVTGGYARVDYSNPADGGYGVGHSTIGGYEIGPILATNGSTGSGIVNYGFTGGDRIVNVSFITGKYQHDAQWSAAVGYYRYDQKSYALGVNSIPGIVAPGYSSVACFSRTFINCAGAEQVASFRIDYDWTKNFRLYAGVAYSRVDGGFGFSYLNNSTFDPTVGMKISF
jgi:predicted porin